MKPDTPLDLPRLVMRRALGVALLTLGVVLLVALLRVAQNIDDEVDAALSLAAAMSRLSQVALNGARLDDTGVIDALRAHQRETPLRHLSLRLRDGAGQLLLSSSGGPPDSAPMAWLLAAHRAWQPGAPRAAVEWPVPRPDGPPWTVTLSATRESERREALESLAGLLAVLLAGVSAMLAVMYWNVRRALRPLQGLLAAIARIEEGQTQAVRALPAMPIRELQAIATALQRLGGALESAEAQRRMLGHKVLTLQEDERARLARELHDEFGQRLTALRVDAAWLTRRLPDDPQVLAVLNGMAAQIELIQNDTRGLLARLQPLGPDDSAVDSLARLDELLRALADGWGRGSAQALRIALDLSPALAANPRLGVPRALALALYRISQEALTNVARHADATQATLVLRLDGPAQAGSAVRLHWSVCDDGIGLADPAAALRRGNGLAGVKERVWALGGDLALQPAHPDAARPGLCLQASLEVTLLDVPEETP